LGGAAAESGAVVTHRGLPTVVGQASQLGQVFQNLIANAIKFHGQAAPQVVVSAGRDDHEWLFSVQDNGIGIEPACTERIFAPFQRLNAREEYSGTGMGLALCKKIIEQHGGRIWAEAKPSQGTRILFTLPVTLASASDSTSRDFVGRGERAIVQGGRASQ
jgi:two-component system, chemotaxis family, sensor kinase Cph1